MSCRTRWKRVAPRETRIAISLRRLPDFASRSPATLAQTARTSSPTPPIRSQRARENWSRSCDAPVPIEGNSMRAFFVRPVTLILQFPRAFRFGPAESRLELGDGTLGSDARRQAHQQPEAHGIGALRTHHVATVERRRGGERQPHVGSTVQIGAVEFPRQHAYHRERTTLQPDFAPDHGVVSGKLGLPELIAQDRRKLARDCVLRRQDAAQHGRNSQLHKVVRGDDLRGDQPHGGAIRREGGAPISG